MSTLDSILHQMPEQNFVESYKETFKERLVTIEDKWCYKPSLKSGQPLKEGDWGYIIAIPPRKSLVIMGFEGYSIVRAKKSAKQILLQIVPTFFDKYYYVILHDRELFIRNLVK